MGGQLRTPERTKTFLDSSHVTAEELEATDIMMTKTMEFPPSHDPATPERPPMPRCARSDSIYVSPKSHEGRGSAGSSQCAAATPPPEETSCETGVSHAMASADNAEQTGTERAILRVDCTDADVLTGDVVEKTLAEIAVTKCAQPTRRLRLAGKRPLPRDHVMGDSSPDVSTSLLTSSRECFLSKATAIENAPLPRSHTTVIRASIGHILAPAEQGSTVLVQGDGWGGGNGTYLATITEADAQTFTVIRHGAWDETHVLREHCCVRSRAGDSDNDSRHSAKKRRVVDAARSITSMACATT